jgi:excisionase family DNA binding protein
MRARLRRQAESSVREQERAQQQLTSIDQASKRLSVSSFTMRRLVKAGQLRAVRVGKRVLIPETEIARIVREGCGPYASAR